MSMSRSRISASWLIASLFALAGFSGQVSADPPMRVARVSFISGDVSMQPAGLNEWSQAMINRPMSTGDALYLDRAALAELDIGAATIRIDERTSLRILELDDQRAQIELTAGTINLSIRNVYEGQYYEIATPTLAFVVEQPGIYRVDISPSGDSTMISVVDGNGTVYGQGDASYSVNDGRSYRFNDTSLADYQIFSLPVRDEFDEWCLERAQRYDDSQSRRYVSEDVIGYSDLDEYGSWGSAPSYGSIWYPRGVSVGWAPYRNGRWAWIDPWGWTWVDNSPWGFAPFHYGRWAYVGSRWGWVPGPRVGRPIYAPALVAFVGGGGFSVGISSGPIGWFPLGPRDVYVPWYQGSRNYFNNINVRNTTVINNTYITNVYNDYSNGRPINNANYAYRDNDQAVTAVARDTFVNARSVDLARVRVSRAELQRAEVVSRVQIAPTQRSFTGGSAARGNGGAQTRNADFERTVIARTAPPASKPNAQERIRAIGRNENQPLAVNQMRDLSARTPSSDVKGGDRVKVVGDGRVETANAKPLPTKSPGQDTGRQERVATDRAAAGSDPARKPVNAQAQDKTAGSNPSARQPRPGAGDTRDREVSRDQTKPNQPDQPATRSTKPAGTTLQSGVVTSPRSRVEKDSTRADAQRTQRDPAARTQPAVDQRKQPSQPAAEPIRSPEQAKPAATSRTVQRAPQQQKDNRVQQPQPRSQPAPQQREVQQKTPPSPANQQRQEQPRATTRPPQVPQQQPAPQQQKQQAQQRQVQPQPQRQQQQQKQQQQQQPQPQQQRQQPPPQQQRQAQPQAAPVQANPQRQQRKAKETNEEDEEKSERKQRGG